MRSSPELKPVHLHMCWPGEGRLGRRTVGRTGRTNMRTGRTKIRTGRTKMRTGRTK